MNNICTTVVSFCAWSSGLLHGLVFRVRRFHSRRIQSKRARMMRDGVPEADLPVGKAHMKRRRRQVFADTSLSLRRGHTCLLQAIAHPCPVTHLAVSPTCPFRRRVCTALLLFGVLFGEWSAQAITYLSFSVDGLQSGHTRHYRQLQAITHLAVSPKAPLYSSADGLQRPLPTCAFRQMVCRAPLLVLFGERSPVPGSPTCPSVSTGSTLPYVLLSFSADGLHMSMISYVSPFTRRAPTTHR